MTDGPSDPNLDQAMDMLMQLRDAPADPALRRRVDAWIAETPEHARAWARAKDTWRLLGEMSPEHADEWSARPHAVLRRRPAAAERPRQARARQGRPLPFRAAWVGIAAFAICLAFIAAPLLTLHVAADEVTAAGELRQVVLSDGTRVHMGPKTAIRVDYTADRRMVRLLAGEAFFEVVPEAERQFVVEAEGLDVGVTGTAFDVRLAAGSVSVAVRSGTVGARYRRIEPAVSARLGAGDRLTVDRATGAALRDRIDPSEVAAWRDGYLFVADSTVAEVAAELGRYNAGWIYIADDRLASRRVTGLYDLHDPGQALPALVQPFGGRVRTVTPFLHILSMP